MNKRKLALCFLFMVLGSFCVFGQNYKAFLEQGQKLYNDRQYDAALKVLRAGLADSDAEGTVEINSWIKRCNDAKSALAAKAKADRERFDLSTRDVSFFSEGGNYEVTVDAAGEWFVVSSPEWCSVEKLVNSMSVSCEKNKDLVLRTGEITLAMTYMDGKTQRRKEASVTVSQDAREVETRLVRFVTVPGNSLVRLPDDKINGPSSDTYTLKEGQHKVTISKPMYRSAEFTINISPEDSTSIIYHRVELEPEFAVLRLSIESSDGSMLTEESLPSLRIGEHYVGLSPLLTGKDYLSFDTADEISYYRLYEGGVIPVEPGSVMLTAQAENYYSYEETLSIENCDDKVIKIVLEPRKGSLIVLDKGGAEGASILVDKKETGHVPTTLLLPKGSHVIEFVKPKYISEKKSYLVDIDDVESTLLEVEMSPYTTVSITSNPSRAAVHIDDNDVNTYTPVVNGKVAQGIHNFRIEKQGYLTQFGEINVMGDSLSLHFDLPEAFPLKIRTDEDENFIVRAWDKSGKLLTPPESVTSNVLNLPYGKYALELLRVLPSSKLFDDEVKFERAYKGRMDFRGQETIRKMTFSRNNFALLGGVWYPSGIAVTATTMGDTYGQYSAIGSANFLKFKLFKGFSTSLLRASAFRNIKEDANPDYLFTGTCLFLNGEFRLGAAVLDYLDVCAVGTYAWTPDISFLNFTQLNYIYGWDWFAGIELSSRIPVLNGSIKLGWHGINGTVSTFNKDQGKTKNLTSPFQGGNFVVSLGFTLGGSDSKGVNMIRLF